MVNDIRCHEDAANITECGIRLEGDYLRCNPFNNMWLSCSSYEPTGSMGLYKYNDDTGELVKGTEGFLIVNFVDKYDEANVISSAACGRNPFNEHAADLMCQQLGYVSVKKYGVTRSDGRYIPNRVLEEHKIPNRSMVSRIYFREDAINFNECTVKYGMYDDFFGCSS